MIDDIFSFESGSLEEWGKEVGVLCLTAVDTATLSSGATYFPRFHIGCWCDARQLLKALDNGKYYKSNSENNQYFVCIILVHMTY